jgi:3-deoxy-manno-octulosonate cytidylyltransferase (CMP-KDO synthetase)
MIRHVYEAAKGSVRASDVIVATDNEAILETVLGFGGKVIMTSREHRSGTDRVAEVARSVGCDVVVNVQGDEPLIQPRMIDDVIGLLDDRRADIGTLVKKIEDPGEIADPNVVKAVVNREGFALYFSRAPVPYHRDEWHSLNEVMAATHHASRITHHCLKHVGIYGYRRDVLLRLAEMEPTGLEETEKLEQLRALENGFRIKTMETSFEIIGVDTPNDLERVETWLSLSS